ncbi:MAG: C25 family cysteine peptidase [Blastocatellia bacterium]
MMASTRRARQRLILPLTLAGVTGWLFLPGFPLGRASATTRVVPGASMQNPATGLDPERQAALAKLYAQVRAGAPASEEEADILRRFASGLPISQLEADVAISRALYAYYISGSELTREQEVLLARYKSFVARRETDIRDLKTQLLNKRKAAAANAPPRDTPLAAPLNDQCAGAEVIPAAGPFPFTTDTTADITDATTVGDPPLASCQTNVSRSIWYRFTPNATGQYAISSCANAPTATTVDDTVMAIYTSGSCGGPFTEVPSGIFTDGCDDDTCAVEAFQAEITTQLTAGTNYFIVVWLFDTPAPVAGQTSVQLRVAQLLPAANDTCAGATALSLNTPVDATTTSGTTPIANNDYQLSGSACFSGIGQTAVIAGGIDLVYSFTAPTAGDYSFRVFNYENTVSSNLVLYVASSCPAATPPTPETVNTCLGASNRSPDGLAEEVMCLNLAASQQVFIFVDEAAPTLGSAFTIEVTRCVRETEPNDTPATADPLAFGIEGSISTAIEADFYSLGTPAAGSRVFALVDGVAAGNRDFDLRVTTTTDTLEFDDINNDAKFGEFSPNVAGTSLAGVPSFLRVNVNAASILASEPYRLYAVVQPPGVGLGDTSATAETEPNNLIANATQAANNFFSGTLAPSTDVDIFSFTASAGDLVYIGLDGDPLRNNTPIDLKLELLSAAGTVLVAVDDVAAASDTTPMPNTLTGDRPFSPAEGIVYRVIASGTHYARVSTQAIGAPPAGDYLLSISRNGSAGPTAVKLSLQEAGSQMKASRYSDGVLLHWRTGMEVDNLGFNVYREEGRKRIRLNQQLLAGSALMIGPDTTLRSGRRYAWKDPSQFSPAARYWIEDVDLNGTTTLHGPIPVDGSNVLTGASESQQAMLLGQLGRNNSRQNTTTDVEPGVALAAPGAADADRQASLAGQTALKIEVRQAGIYKVTQPELAAAGLDPKANPRLLQLYADGQELPISVTGEKDGSFDSSDAIEFYGLGLDTASTDTRTYWLVVGTSPGKRIGQVTSGANRIGAGFFPQTVERKDRTIYFSALRNGDKENFFGAVIAGAPVDQALTLRHLAATSLGQATLEVALQGVTNVPHRVRIDVNGRSSGELSFDGQVSGVTQFALPQSLFKEGHNLIRLTPLAGASDVSLVDYIRITYWHAFIAESNSLRFTATGKQIVTVDGFSSSQVRMFDVTAPNAIQELLGTIKKGNSGFNLTIAVHGSGQRTLIAMTNDQAKSAASVTANRPSSWRLPTQAADLVIFTRSEFATAIEPLRSLRQSQGLNTAVVNIDDVYDEFSYGNQSPQALKDFLYYAKTHWRVAPRFVLLAGDSSYDPKNYLGLGDYDLVPTRLIDTRFMETASDDWFVDFDGYGVPEVSVGRLPMRNALEAASIVAKLVSYEQFQPSENVLLVSDTNDGYDFETMSGQLRRFIPESAKVEEINRGQADAAAVKSSLLKALSRGPRLVNYAGHGSSDQWRGNLFTSSDARALTNTQSLSLFFSMTCLTGFFQDPSIESLAEALLKSRGGAVAVWASSGMTEPGGQAAMDREIFKLMLDSVSVNGQPQTLGEATARAKAGVSDGDVRRTWILFGDPSTRLR